jgi:hypothetical protein
MAVPSAQQIAQNWQQAMGSPQTQMRYKQGISNTTVNPMALAAQPDAQARYVANVQQSVTSGKREQALNAVNVQTWKDNASNVGASRLATGAQKAQQKYMNFATKWQPIYQQVHDAVAAMPKGGAGNAVARSAKAIQMLMAAAGKA